MERTEPQSPWLPPAAPPAPPPPYEERRKSLGQRLLGPIVAAGVLLAKFGKVALLLLTKAKFLTTSLSMLVSIAAYSLIWGWKFAVGFVALLFVHEMGHAIQMRREGVPISGVVFIPFLGAMVAARSLGGNALAEARIGLAGPILGTAGAAAILPFAGGSDFLHALAFTGFFLNLFNLVPVVPFDGGRAMAAMAPWMWWVGFAAMVAFFIAFPNPILILFLLLGGMESWRRWKQRRQGEEGNAAYYRVAPRHRLLVAAVYVGLIAACAIGMDASFVDQSHRI
jgi:Zn-dependent protease